MIKYCLFTFSLLLITTACHNTCNIHASDKQPADNLLPPCFDKINKDKLIKDQQILIALIYAWSNPDFHASRSDIEKLLRSLHQSHEEALDKILFTEVLPPDSWFIAINLFKYDEKKVKDLASKYPFSPKAGTGEPGQSKIRDKLQP